MEFAETLKWTGVYLGLWLFAALLGAAMFVLGIALGGLAALGVYQLTPFVLRLALYPTGGLVVMGLGILVFKVGTAAASIHVIVSATEARLPAALDTQGVKSDILSVLDDRLSEMHDDLRETRRLAGGRANDPGDFELE